MDFATLQSTGITRVVSSLDKQSNNEWLRQSAINFLVCLVSFTSVKLMNTQLPIAVNARYFQRVQY